MRFTGAFCLSGAVRGGLAAGASKLRTDEGVCLAGGAVPVDVSMVGSVLSGGDNR